jgi:HSP20 family protein
MPRQITAWTPLRDLIQMREAMSRLWDENTTSAGRDESSGKPCFRLPVDAYSTEDAIVVEAAIAGATPDEVDITIDGDSLNIRAEIKPSESDEDRSYLIRERGYGILERSLTLNLPVELDKIEAKFNNGVLTLVIPKAEAVKPRKIAVKAAK